MKGIMIDCSRNAVMNIKSVKRFADIAAALAYDTLMLYTEDTYEVDNEPYFGYMRGRYSKAEIKETDEYCEKLGIELIPCIQTLAHLNTMFKWTDEYECIRDYDDILLADENRTYILIENMFKTAADCFHSRKIHIGMDEAYMVGLGKYLQKHGFKERFNIINKHLHTVCKIAEKYGFKPMIWSDMFCKLAAENSDYYMVDNIDALRAKADLPENISLVYWDYYSKNYDRYLKMLKINKAFERPVIFAGGAWTWKGFAPDNTFSIETMKQAFKACRDEKTEDIFITVWGDDGGECSRFSVLPALTYASCILSGDEESVKEKFSEITGMKYEDFMLFDMLDTPNQKLGGNPSKYLLYNDPFSGVYDYCIESGVNNYYSDLRDRLAAIVPKEEYRPLVEFYISLCDALSVKSELGIHTRSAYASKDRKKLLQIAENEYKTAILKIENCYKAYRKLWFYENKPYGFDIQDIRFGGLMKRIESCRERLVDYCNGKYEDIPELEEKLLYGHHRGATWARIASSGVISHIV